MNEICFCFRKSNKLRMKKIDSVLARFFQRRSGADSKSLTSVTANEDENTTSDEDDEEDEEDIDAVESGDESFNMDMENSVTQVVTEFKSFCQILKIFNCTLRFVELQA